MILSDIRNYLKKREMATLSDIALYINADELAVQGMLEVLIRRGEISLGQKSTIMRFVMLTMRPVGHCSVFLGRWAKLPQCRCYIYIGWR